MMEKAYDTFLTTLSNKNRLRIINCLRDCGKNVTEIIAATHLNQTTVSHNLKRLLTCGFVAVKQRGKHRYYQLNRETIGSLMKLIDKHVDKYCRKLLCNNSRGD